MHHELLGATDPERDRTEMLLGRWALEDSKPLLAICRGIQVLNVVNGGSLYQDIRALRDGSEKHDYFPPQFERVRISHEVQFQPDSRLARIYGPTTMVNSMHHQALKSLGARLPAHRLGARRRGGGHRGAGHPFALGVQWHPEELATHLHDSPSRRPVRRLRRAVPAVWGGDMSPDGSLRRRAFCVKCSRAQGRGFPKSLWDKSLG